ncbi:hypothetical protein NDU88_008901 [Pleurodeles waltl]|uniref:Uncharacterized protein n=1 Tax=Pleurodeles waltl TaxID=8319 RepID=A0AAV7RUH8_PLEWA|nr:hypothetical protein NDU88_008901 [Pleurodeles waltl]
MNSPDTSFIYSKPFTIRDSIPSHLDPRSLRNQAVDPLGPCRLPEAPAEVNSEVSPIPSHAAPPVRAAVPHLGR